VKLTTQKFYRINGGATQLRGVTPDIILPDVYEKLEVGEKELDFVMNWDQTTSSPFETWSKKPDLAKLKAKSKERVSKNPYFRYVEEEAVKLKQRQDASVYALDLKGYQAQQAAAKDPEDKAKEFSKNITGFNAVTVTANVEINKSNPAKEEVEKGFIQRITKDYYLEEAVYILSEM
jgi:carboxyl-terminal processing protease